jgi:hypothetical protein
MGSLGVRPRRGAWEGSRRARVLAATCFAAVATAAALPPAASAYPCGEAPTPAPTKTRQLSGISPDECRVPETLRRAKAEPRRERKRGSVSGLTVFVLAIAGALLIPIGRNGLPHGGDPFGRDAGRSF